MLQWKYTLLIVKIIEVHGGILHTSLIEKARAICTDIGLTSITC